MDHFNLLEILKYICFAAVVISLLKYLTSIIVALIALRTSQAAHKDSLTLFNKNGSSLEIHTTSLKFNDLKKIKEEIALLENNKTAN